MKKLILLFSVGFLFANSALANNDCFIAQENGHIIQEEGNCKARHSPCSTFKIAISLMGYNEGILIDETHPELPFQQSYADWQEVWKQNHNPTSWMKNSVVWYSQIITQKLGKKKFHKYLTKFNYGNRDVSGDKGKDNGLTRSWLSSSLEISPHEQIKFLQKLVDRKLPVSKKAQEMTKNILFAEEYDGWKFYGKTGAGDIFSKDGSLDKTHQIGWYVGFIEKENRKIIFARYIENDGKQDYSSGKKAKSEAIQKLLELI